MFSLKTFAAIVLAGDRPSDPLAKMSPRNRKCLLDLHGQPMLLHVLDTLSSSPQIGNIVVVANAVTDLTSYVSVRDWCRRNHSKNISFVEGADGPAASVLSALKMGQLNSPPILLTTADNPLLSGDALSQFCLAIQRMGNADVAIALATRSSVQSSFPNAKRTYIMLQKEGYTGCNLFAFLTNSAEQAATTWQSIEAHRKNAWRFISFFGILTLIKALIGNLSLESAFKAVSKSMSLIVKPVILNDPSAAMDVDRPEHIEIVEKLLKKKGLSVQARHQ